MGKTWPIVEHKSILVSLHRGNGWVLEVSSGFLMMKHTRNERRSMPAFAQKKKGWRVHLGIEK